MFVSRPKKSETDEDLLKLQEEFFKKKAENQISPSAKVVSENKSIKNEEAQEIDNKTEVERHLSSTFEEIPKNAKLGVIKEKPQMQASSVFVSRSLQGFPKARRRDLTDKPTRGSIFASQMKKQRLESSQSEGGVFLGQLTIKEKIEGGSKGNEKKNIPEQSYILMGEDKDELHKENVDKLVGMSEEEILEERQNLIETIDPALIAFLKSRRSNIPVVDKKPSMVEQMQIGNEIKLEQLEAPMEILDKPEAEKWLNFDVVETSKLAWMKDVDLPVFDKTKPYEARFDFDGHILPYSEKEISEKNRILYHHGEEPGRPGYTLQELFQLGRSSVIQQKIIALNAIANILALDSLGLYEGIIELPVEQIFFVLRFCMDDNTPSVLNSAIKALRNLFVYSVDETCIDALLGFGIGMTQPSLAIDPEEFEDDPTVNDQQLAEQNLVKCLLRSDILVRVRYVINTVQPPIETIVYILDILTRLARDSNFTCMRLYKFENLLGSVIRGAGHVPEAFKFLRVLSSKSVGYARDLIANFAIMDTISSILSNIHVSVHPKGLKLQIEVLRLWTVFTYYGLATDYFEILQPILVQLFDYHLRNTDLDPNKTSYLMQSHVSALLNLFSAGFKKQISTVFPTVLVETAFSKWSNQFCNLDNYTCGKLQIISSILSNINALIAYDYKKSFDLTVIEQCLQKMLNTQGFLRITGNIRSGSNVLSNCKSKKCSPNLLSVEAAIWEAPDHVVPVIQANSCLPFLASFSNLLLKIDNPKVKFSFLANKNINKYIGLLKGSDKFSLVDNWFTQVETKLIMNILKIAASIKNEIDLPFFYEGTIQCLPLFTTQQKSDIDYIFRKIIFNIDFLPTDLLFQNLSISNELNLLKMTLETLPEIVEVYCQVLGVTSGDPSAFSSLCLACPIKTIAPVDWIYTPIIVQYSEQQQNKNLLPEDVLTDRIKACLRWIYLYELHFTNLAALINPTERFCRLACVLLGKDDLFLDKDINALLEQCLKCVLKSGLNKIDFNKPIEGLNNFQDFYVQLLEQYQGVSYGNLLFGNFILIPLVQRFDVKWRKILWSEYAGVVQIFNVTQDKLLIDFSEFVKEGESDISLLKCYKRCLDSGYLRRPSVLRDLAKFHTDCYLEKITKKKNIQ